MKIELFGEKYSISAFTTGGRRDYNQDCFAWVAVSSEKAVGETPDGTVEGPAKRSDDMLLALVCDGLGGLEDGEKASRTVASGLSRWASEAAGDHDALIRSMMEEVVKIEKDLMHDYPCSATTLSAVLASEGRWTSLHLGDSRCYTVLPDRIERTKDHSPTEKLFREGKITEDEMNTHPKSNLMDMAVGNRDAEKLEIGDLTEGWSRLVLCSDGASGYMSVAEFHKNLKSAADAKEIADTAYSKGSTDNITVLTVDRV